MDKDTFVSLIEAKGESLYRVAWAILGNNADVADALQETALNAWQHRDKLRQTEYFGTWVTRICINVCRRIKRKRRPVISLEEAPEAAAPPPDMTLSLALRSLPENLRLPLMLQYAEGMSYLEISQVLRISEAAVRGRIFRAKQQLRKELEV
ncbi:MAG: sigma-70 family RNA polymerase sigma factor [Clostridia bacterium]|nr:sigma-70 family RNA polymerase sigma factor [Clostridia bacterium]